MKVIDHINQDFMKSTYTTLDEKTLSGDQGQILELEKNYLSHLPKNYVEDVKELFEIHIEELWLY